MDPIQHGVGRVYVRMEVAIDSLVVENEKANMPPHDLVPADIAPDLKHGFDLIFHL